MPRGVSEVPTDRVPGNAHDRASSPTGTVGHPRQRPQPRSPTPKTEGQSRWPAPATTSRRAAVRALVARARPQRQRHLTRRRSSASPACFRSRKTSRRRGAPATPSGSRGRAGARCRCGEQEHAVCASTSAVPAHAAASEKSDGLVKANSTLRRNDKGDRPGHGAPPLRRTQARARPTRRRALSSAPAARRYRPPAHPPAARRCRATRCARHVRWIRRRFGAGRKDRPVPLATDPARGATLAGAEPGEPAPIRLPVPVVP